MSAPPNSFGAGSSRQILPERVADILLKVYAMSTVRQLGTTDPLYASALCVNVGSSLGSVLGTHCEQGDGKVLRYREGDARELTFAPRQSIWTPEGCGSVLNLNSQPQLNLKPGGPVAWHLRLPSVPGSTTLSRSGPLAIGYPPSHCIPYHGPIALQIRALERRVWGEPTCSPATGGAYEILTGQFL